VLELSSVDLGEIAEALADQADYERLRLINPDTGAIVFWTADTGIDGQTPVDLDDLDPELHQGNADLLPVWYAFSDARARRRAVEWLVENSLVEDEAAERFLASHPDPELP
jgi:hypothetical protein